MRIFGCFKGMEHYNVECEEFDTYKSYKNKLPKEAIIAHIESLDIALACMSSKDIFTGEYITAGRYQDGEFVFPTDFLHYYKNYDIGIPYDYEEYLKGIIQY